MASLLDGATYTGIGPQMIPGNNQHQPDNSDFLGFDYGFQRGSTSLRMLWRVNGSVTIYYPVQTSQVDLIDRDGGVTRLNASNGSVEITIGPRPIYLRRVACDARFSDVCPDH